MDGTDGVTRGMDVVRKIQAMMSDPALKGRVFWLLMTARIHLLSPDLRRPGRAGDLIIPVLDPEGVRWLRDFLRRFAAEGKTVFVSSHILSEVQQIADHVAILAKGRLVTAGPVGEVLAAGGARGLIVKVVDLAAGHISIRWGLKGINFAPVSACSTGNHAIGEAFEIIKRGDADVIVAGGFDAGVTPLGHAGFCAARALSTRNDDPQAASRPWDKDRDGFVLGDGAGAIVLEEYEHAKKRGANIVGELIGFGMSDDAFHMTSPPEDGAGAALSMRNALASAGIAADAMHYINAHGTSTPAGDIAEARAVKSVFGAHAKMLAVSSTKSMHGHLLGAAGAVEAIITLLAIRDQVAPPTINLVDPDEAAAGGWLRNVAPHVIRACALLDPKLIV